MGHMVVATKPPAEDTNSVCKCSAAFAFRDLRWTSTEVRIILYKTFVVKRAYSIMAILQAELFDLLGVLH